MLVHEDADDGVLHDLVRGAQHITPLGSLVCNRISGSYSVALMVMDTSFLVKGKTAYRQHASLDLSDDDDYKALLIPFHDTAEELYGQYLSLWWNSRSNKVTYEINYAPVTDEDDEDNDYPATVMAFAENEKPIAVPEISCTRVLAQVSSSSSTSSSSSSSSFSSSPSSHLVCISCAVDCDAAGAPRTESLCEEDAKALRAISLLRMMGVQELCQMDIPCSGPGFVGSTYYTFLAPDAAHALVQQIVDGLDDMVSIILPFHHDASDVRGKWLVIMFDTSDGPFYRVLDEPLTDVEAYPADGPFMTAQGQMNK